MQRFMSVMGYQRRPAIVLLSALFLAGCAAEDEGKVDAPFEGTWQVGAPFDSATFYRIDVRGNGGTLSVETKGEVTKRLKFKREGSSTIVFKGVSREPHVLPTERFDTRRLVDITRLVDPPKKLSFVDVGSERPAGIAADRKVLGIDGLIENFPIAIPMVSMGEEDRVQLPFRPITGDVDLSAGNFLARGSGDGEPLTGMNFTTLEPQTPQGKVNSLTIAGHDIGIAVTELQDGMLTTDDFGDLEIVLTGSGSGGGMQVRGTADQIRAIGEWLKDQDE